MCETYLQFSKKFLINFYIFCFSEIMGFNKIHFFLNSEKCIFKNRSINFFLVYRDSYETWKREKKFYFGLD